MYSVTNCSFFSSFFYCSPPHLWKEHLVDWRKSQGFVWETVWNKSLKLCSLTNNQIIFISHSNKIRSKKTDSIFISFRVFFIYILFFGSFRIRIMYAFNIYVCLLISSRSRACFFAHSGDECLKGKLHTLTFICEMLGFIPKHSRTRTHIYRWSFPMRGNRMYCRLDYASALCCWSCPDCRT